MSEGISEDERKQIIEFITKDLKALGYNEYLIGIIKETFDLYQKEKERNKEFLSNKMTLEEAKQIIDDMYQDKYKPIEEKTKEGATIYIERLDNVIFSEVEFAGVRLLREVQILERKLKNSISKDKIREKIKELDIEIQQCQYADDDIEEYKNDMKKEKSRLLRDKKILQELLEANNEKQM